MKIMRFFPLLALATLGFICYGLYKTSNFINKKVDKYTLLSQDSLVKTAADSVARLNSNKPVLSDNLSVSPTITTATEQLAATPIPVVVPKQEATTSKKDATPTSKNGTTAAKKDATSVEVKKDAAPTSKQTTSDVKKDPASAESLTTKGASAATNVSPKTAPVVTAKGVVDAAKTPQTRAITKPATDKAATTAAPTATVKKEAILKPASITAKKEVTETRFYVVVGSYGQEANAKNKAAAFEQKNNKKATIVKQGGFFRVCADEFEFGQAASQYAQKLKEAGEESIIVKF